MNDVPRFQPPIVIAEWDKSGREKVRVTLDRYKEHDTVDCRLWWPSDDGSLRPGKG